ncbi:restriction endonuclease subunit S [Flavobacterium sp. XS2P24]|uniref:restriction endonuclease subunit S n=1 Tax=Flavobacterium sp. XS2P24 TaxID=3041249 RepID=UPI0024A874F1|nr:restriction endonuclease subunit S [Flavobacterium sp. XS2P24]MDI6049415.1 restriction endonuclease subunit S [Flavobacterium sp. XS2P24]
MKSSYKKLGNYIQVVNKRDTDKTVDKLLGVSIRKVLIPSIANIIGTDMSTYKIIKKNQFAYGPVTSRNGDKISVAILEDYDEAIVSQAYTVFEVIDKNKLLPEYLMMWFRRPEFDRYSRFKSQGSAREIFGWDEMCDTELPIPSIEKQVEIVREYNIIQNRIALNNQLIAKLEETAQAIYKQWFVDFEFPDENGKPYKNNGGKMIWSAELEIEIPEGWSVNLINEYIKLSQGLAMNAANNHLVVEKGIPLLRITDLINKTAEIFISEKVEKNVIAVKEDIIVSRTGQVGLVFRNKIGVVYNNCFKVNPFQNLNKEVLYWFLKTKKMYLIMNELASGSSAQLDLTHKQFYTLKFVLPTFSLQLKFSEKSIRISKHLEICELQVQKLEELKELLLAKMTKVN